MIEWLKTTIPGIIVLGASGSLLAIGLLKLIAFVLRRFVRPKTNSILIRAFLRRRSLHHVFQYLRSSSSDSRELVVMCSVLIAVFLMSLITIEIGLIALMGADVEYVIAPSKKFYLLLSFWGTVVSVFGAYYALKSFSRLIKLYEIFMAKAHKNASVKALKELKQRFK